MAKDSNTHTEQGEDERDYDRVAAALRGVFRRKNRDYGSSWEMWRMSTFIDMIRSKAHRLIQLEKMQQEGTQSSVDESLEDTWADIANYAILALMKSHRLEKSQNNMVDSQ